MMTRIQLTGRNDARETREVYVYDGTAMWRELTHIGSVVPVTHVDCLGWEARDLEGKTYGDRWLAARYAAESLVTGLRLWGRKPSEQNRPIK